MLDQLTWKSVTKTSANGERLFGELHTADAWADWDRYSTVHFNGADGLMMLISIDGASTNGQEVLPVQLHIGNYPLRVRERMAPLTIGYIPEIDPTGLTQDEVSEAKRLMLHGMLAIVFEHHLAPKYETEGDIISVNGVLHRVLPVPHALVADQVGKMSLLCMSKSPKSARPCHICKATKEEIQTGIAKLQDMPALRDANEIARDVEWARALLSGDKPKKGQADRLLALSGLANAIHLAWHLLPHPTSIFERALYEILHNGNLGVYRDLFRVTLNLVAVCLSSFCFEL